MGALRDRLVKQGVMLPQWVPKKGEPPRSPAFQERPRVQVNQGRKGSDVWMPIEGVKDLLGDTDTIAGTKL